METERINMTIGNFNSLLKRSAFPIEVAVVQPGESSLEQQLRAYFMTAQELEPLSDLRDEIDGDNPNKYPLLLSCKLLDEQKQLIQISFHCEVQSWDLSLRAITLKSDDKTFHKMLEKETDLPKWNALLTQFSSTESAILPIKCKTTRQLEPRRSPQNKIK